MNENFDITYKALFRRYYPNLIFYATQMCIRDSDMPSSKNICMNLASPLVNCVTLYLIGVIFVTPFHWTL